MQHDLKWLFTAPYSKGELEKEIQMAEAIIDTEHTAYPDSSFEDGYIAALNFVLGKEQSSMREEYEALHAEGKLNGQAP
ncbi:MAG: hypothetical protein ACRDD9_04355 [Shewanella sp.]